MRSCKVYRVFPTTNIRLQMLTSLYPPEHSEKWDSKDLAHCRKDGWLDGFSAD